MTVLLALETSTQTCSVALLIDRDGPLVLDHREVLGSAGHALHLLPLVDELLTAHGIQKDELTAVAFDQGPGAFTGLRLACGTAQGLGMALSLPLVPVGALLAVAAATNTLRGRIIVSALDARMDEMYLAVYVKATTGSFIELQPPLLVPAADAQVLLAARGDLWRKQALAQGIAVEQRLMLVGEGWKLASEVQHAAFSTLGCELLNAHELPHARWIARLASDRLKQGHVVDPEHAAPLYLRDKVAFTIAERERGDGGNPKASLRHDVSLLPMTLNDVDEVIDIERAVQSFPWSEKNFQDALDAGYEAWVLRDADQALGFCVAMAAPDVTHILVIAVAKQAQRKGFASLMLDHISRNARARSAEGLLLEVRPSNLAAREFYERYGFEQIGVRRHYYPAGRGDREDALVLKKVFLGAE